MGRESLLAKLHLQFSSHLKRICKKLISETFYFSLKFEIYSHAHVEHRWRIQATTVDCISLAFFDAPFTNFHSVKVNNRPFFQWIVNDTTIKWQKAKSYVFFQNPSKEDGGNYVVRAVNEMGDKDCTLALNFGDLFFISCQHHSSPEVIDFFRGALFGATRQAQL